MSERQREAGVCHDDAVAQPQATLTGARVVLSASGEY